MRQPHTNTTTATTPLTVFVPVDAARIAQSLLAIRSLAPHFGRLLAVCTVMCTLRTDCLVIGSSSGSL